MTIQSNTALQTICRLHATTSDDALVLAIPAGNRAAVGLLYARHADTLRATAVAALPKHDEPSADDIVQEVSTEGRCAMKPPIRETRAYIPVAVRAARAQGGRETLAGGLELRNETESTYL